MKLLVALMMSFNLLAVESHYEAKAVAYDKAYGYGYSSDETVAMSNAIEDCESYTNKSCTVVYVRWVTK